MSQYSHSRRVIVAALVACMVVQVACAPLLSVQADPLNVAADSDDVKFVREWVGSGKRVTVGAIAAAVGSGSMRVLHFFFEEDPGGTDPDQEVFGMTLLKLSIEYDRAEVTKYLLSQHASIDKPSGGEGFTALFVPFDAGLPLFDATRICGQRMQGRCVEARATAITKLLLDEGADPKIRSRNGFSPLHFAVMKGYVEASSLLIQHGAEVNAEANEGGTPFYFADSEPMVRLLIDRGGDINKISTRDGSTALDFVLHMNESSPLMGSWKSRIELLKRFGARRGAELLRHTRRSTSFRQNASFEYFGENPELAFDRMLPAGL